MPLPIPLWSPRMLRVAAAGQALMLIRRRLAADSHSAGRQWLKYVMPDTVYPAFRSSSDRRDVPVFVRIPDVPRHDLPDGRLFAEAEAGSSRLVTPEGLDWPAFYDRVHRELQAGASLLDQLLDAAVAVSDAESGASCVTFEGFLRPLLHQRCRLLELIWAGQLAATLDSSDRTSFYARMVDSLLRKTQFDLTECYRDADYLDCLERLRKEDKTLTDQQLWVVTKEIRECRRACFYDATAVRPPKHMSAVALQLAKLAESRARFETNVLATGSFCRLVVSDPSLFEPYTRPEFLEYLRTEDGMYMLTLAPGAYEEFVQVCSDRATRRAAWSAHSGVAGRLKHMTSRMENGSVISDQRLAGDIISESLGYANLLEVDLRERKQDGMPQSVQSVVELLEALKRRYQPVALDHFNRVSDFAQDNGGLEDGPLQPWDWPYWQRRLLAAHNWPPAVPLAQLRANWFDLLAKLFGLRFLTNPGLTESAARLHPNHSVEAFDLRDERRDGALLGRMIWFSGGRIRKITYPVLGGTGCLTRLYLTDAASNQQQQPLVVPLAYQAWDTPIVACTDSAAMADRLATVLRQLTGHPALGPYPSPCREEPRAGFLSAVLRCLATAPDLAVQRLLATGCDNKQQPDWPAIEELLAGQLAMALLQELYRAAYAVEMWTTDANYARAQVNLGRDFVPFFLHDLPEDEWPSSALDIFGVQGVRETPLERMFNTVLALDASAVLLAPAPAGQPASLWGARFRDCFLDPDSGHTFVEAYRRFCGRDPSGG